MNRALPAPLRCASFFRGLVPMTACFRLAIPASIRVSKRAAPSNNCRKPECVQPDSMRSCAERTRSEICRRTAGDRPSLRSARRTPAAGQCEGNSQRRRPHPRHRQELRRIAREYSHRLAGQCFPTRAEPRCSPGVEGQWKPCARRSYSSCPGSASGHDRS